MPAFPVDPDLSTPGKALAAFVDAFNRRDSAGMAACLSLNLPAARAARLFASLPDELKSLTVEATRVTVASETASEAAVTVAFRIASASPPPERFRMRSGATGWRIVAPREFVLVRGFVDLVAYAAVDSEMAQQIGGSVVSGTVLVLSNFRQMGLACLMLCQDNREVYQFTPTNFKKALQPYLPSEGVFQSHLDRPGIERVRLNPAMAHVRAAHIQTPERTVLLFEGEPGKPLFRYEGKAAIVLADGLARLMTPAEAKTLLWKA